MTERCTCDRPEVPRDEPCPEHPVEESDPIKRVIAEIRARHFSDAKTPDRRSK